MENVEKELGKIYKERETAEQIYEWREKAFLYDEIMAKRKQASEKSKASLMKNMTPEERKERARKAIQARWGTKTINSLTKGIKDERI